MYDVQFTKQAIKDTAYIEQAGLKQKAVDIINTIRNNPFENSQNFEKLKYDLKGAYSRRITRQHRFVYEVLPNMCQKRDMDGNLFDGFIKVISLWNHYE